MNFQDYVLKYKKPIQRIIDRTLSQWKRQTVSESDHVTDLTQLLLESNNGGKNIRGALVCLGYDLYKSSPKSEVYTVAAAYEILHTSLLIHDDVMDKSIMRRNSPTVYQQLGGDHYGISQAISLGDVGFFLAVQMINNTQIENEIKSSLINHFSHIVLSTITGQMLDIKLAKKLDAITEKDVLTIARLKTAQYTISGPLILGALIAGADQKYIKKLRLFGEALGIAFQIKDDILGIFGDEKVIGKSITSDIEEGKNTLLIDHALQNGTKKQKNFLFKYYGKGKISEEEHFLIKQIFDETEALAYAEKKMHLYTNEALLLIRQLTDKKEMQNILNDFITYLVKRNK